MIGGCRKVAAGGTDLTLSRRVTRRDGSRFDGESLDPESRGRTTKNYLNLIAIISRLINSLLEINAPADAAR